MALSSGLHIVLTENCCEKIWQRWTNFLLTNVLEYVLTMCFSQWNSECPTQLLLLAWLASTKGPKHVLTKGLKLNFQQIHTTNFLWQMKLQIDKIFSSTRTNKVCHRNFAGVHGALGSTTSQAGISIYKITGINSIIIILPFGGLCTTLHQWICQWYTFKMTIKVCRLTRKFQALHNNY